MRVIRYSIKIRYTLYLTGIVLISCFALGCQDKPQNEPATVTAVKPDTAVKFTTAMVDNKKDPSCGMPLSAGIMDTLHYKGKVYGFCSDECKQAFLKNPDTLAKNAVMK